MHKRRFAEGLVFHRLGFSIGGAHQGKGQSEFVGVAALASAMKKQGLPVPTRRSAMFSFWPK